MKSRFAVSATVVVVIVSVLMIALFSSLAATAAPAAPAPTPFKPVVSSDVHHDTSLPLKELAAAWQGKEPQTPLSPEAINRQLPNKAYDPKFVAQLKELGLDVNEFIAPLQEGDGIVQSLSGVPYAPDSMPPTILNWMGNTNIEGYYPPDTNGDIGYDPVTQKKFYMQWVNVRFAIWDVTSGTPVMVVSPTLGNALWAGFGGACETSNDGDPIVLFDQLANRWLASQFALPNYPSGPYYQCIAISQSGDPTGSWYRYAFVASNTKMNDYPHFGIWPDAYYMSVNQFTGGSSWGGAGAFAFERARMLSGLSAQMIYFDLFSANADYGGQLPADWDGITQPPANSPGYFFEVDDNVGSPALGADAMRIWKFHVDWVTPANSTFGINGTSNYTVPVASFDMLPCTLSGSRSCIPQLGTSVQLDGIGDRLMHRAAYRNINGQEVVVMNHTVNAGGGRAGVRWYEVRDIATAPVIYQQGTYAPDDGLYRWMGSIAMDHVGNIAAGFSASSSAVNPSIHYAGRLASDPLGVLAQGHAVIITGTGSQTGSASRWGDYSSLTIDPVDDCTFYYTTEYLTTTSSVGWIGRIASFKFPNCSIGPQGAIAGKVTSAATSNPIVGARIDASSSPTLTYSAFANGSGDYALIVPSGVAYTVTGSAYGYLPASFSNVNVVSGTTTTQNISLTVAPTYVISGYVRDSATTDPLWATVSVIGTPYNPPFASVQTDPNTGFYSMTVAGGQSYTLTASALLHTPASQGVTPVADTTANFNLVATTQNGGIVGWVKNYYTNNPIANATVTVAPGGATSQTDVNGYFQIFNLTPGYYTATATANLYGPVSISNITVLSSNVAIRTFLLPTSQLNYSPAALNKTLTIGQIATDTVGLVISNTGLGSLNFTLQEGQGGFMPLRPAAGDLLVVAANGSTAATQAITTALQALGYTYDVAATRTAFEAMTVSQLLAYRAVIYSGPTDTSTSVTDNPSNTLLRAYLDAGGRVMHVDNDEGYYDWPSTYYQQYLQATFGGDDPGADQSITGEDIMAGIVTNVNSDPFPDYFTPGPDGVRIFRYTAYNNAAGVRTERNGYRTLYLAFDYHYLGGNSTVGDPVETEVMQKSLTWLLGGVPLDVVPWFNQSPLTGTLGTNASQNIQIGWNASVADIVQPGTYTATLKIDNNDPNMQNTVLPVALTVLPSASQGFLTGVVSTTGICDVNPAPINGAQVYLEGSGGFTQTLLTSNGGTYGYWLDSAQNPYTVTVSYADHPTTSVSVNVTGGVTTTQNFTLRLQKACINTSPASLQATAQLGSAAPNQTVYVTSSGALPLTFNVFEVPSNLPVGGGPDAFGYTWMTSTFNYIPANGSGTPLNLTDDAEANILSPFAFPFYGGSSTDLRVGNNGGILFGVTTGDVGVTNSSMASAPDNFIAPFWDDIDDETGNVYWLVTGTAPNRKLVVEWYNRPHYNGIGAVTFEAVLFENGNILYQYLDTDFGNPSYDNGASATSGIRGVGAANSLEYSFNQPKLTNGLALCFVRPGNPPCDAADVPWLTVTPTSTVGLTGTPATSQQLTVGFDSASLPLPGTYTANLLISHNAPQPAVNIPVTFTVTAPATYGQIDGTVTGLAACDAPGAPLQNATVAITGGTVATATTDAVGHYSYYLLGGSAYTLTVSKAGYVSQSAVVTVTQSQTTTTNFNLRLLAPCQNIPTAAFTSTQQVDRLVTQTLTVNNTGAAALSWNILELAPTQLVAEGPQDFDRLPSYHVPFFTPNEPLVNAIQDGSFEATNSTTFANPYWGQGSTTYGTAICSVAGCTPVGGTQAPRTGTFWVWFGGASAGDVGYVQQTVIMTPGVSSLSFYLKMEANANAGNFMKVSIDGTPVFTVTTADQGNYASYTLVTVDVTPFANGTPRLLRFDSTTFGSGNFHVDDVALDITGPACAPNSLPWITAVPVSGTVAAGGSANVSLVFNSTGLTSGVYTGTLCFNSNDTVAPSVMIPVRLNVISEYKLFLPILRR